MARRFGMGVRPDATYSNSGSCSWSSSSSKIPATLFYSLSKKEGVCCWYDSFEESWARVGSLAVIDHEVLGKDRYLHCRAHVTIWIKIRCQKGIASNHFKTLFSPPATISHPPFSSLHDAPLMDYRPRQGIISTGEPIATRHIICICTLLQGESVRKSLGPGCTQAIFEQWKVSAH